METQFTSNRLIDIKGDGIKRAIATQELCSKLFDKVGDSKYIFNFAYTDYGGSFMDKVIIAFAKEYYPDCIVSENTSWYGENAFIFGELARIIGESQDIVYADYKTDFEEFYLNKVKELEIYAFTLISSLFNDSEIVYDWLCENKSGYYHCEPNYLDYNEEELIKELQDEEFKIKEKYII